MRNWRKVLAKEVKNLPSESEFSGDKLPKSGDAAKVELNSWHKLNSQFKQDVNKEHESDSLGILEPKNKRENVRNASIIKRSSILAILKSFLKSKFVPILQEDPDSLTDSDVQKFTDMVDQASSTQELQSIFSLGSLQERGYRIQDWGDLLEEFINTQDSKMSSMKFSDVQFEQKPDGTVKINVEYPSDSGDVNIPNIDEELNSVVNDQTSTPEGTEQLPLTKDKTTTPKESSRISSCNTDIKSWIIKEASNKKLIGRECKDACGIFIEDKSGKVLIGDKIKKTAKFSNWREVINEAVWIAKFDEFV